MQYLKKKLNLRVVKKINWSLTLREFIVTRH